ncbi:MAG TPA: folylpolyglutamate synthase/dihydrofolate synthase family protein [Bacteroidales bacterium]|nr:bifunctional folylpolyglutamate synthase/dihydrofolate synthase [Bacteroidales bacterium]OQA88039.1 MAG: Folylpolyglutamate synthase [Bacteroidetes bacterium ADurb.Bin234]HOS15697.1 folylpolyglutamate synthase/dihydrofolate synthase family protein [Bacteroidales bacterium]
MTYSECLRFLYESLPMYQRIGPAAYKADLNNTIALLNHLHNPQQKLRCIHIAGTNGKGSVSHMIASVLQSVGYNVGLYTSPHLKTFKERIRINGKQISATFITQFVSQHIDFFKELQPSFFEITVAMAFEYFYRKKIDIAVIETGLGGRLDSTNVITPELSVITNIGYDHTQFLGNTLAKIAVEKAGIIKEHIPVIIGETHPETKKVFIETAEKLQAPILFADKQYSLKNLRYFNTKQKPAVSFDIYKNNALHIKHLISHLTGIYQEKNILTVAAALDVFFKDVDITAFAYKNGIKNCVDVTGFKGRWQILQKKPLCIADIAHNEDGIRMICKQLASIPHQKLHFVLGVVNDKDLDAILKLLPREATYYFCKAKIPRGLDVKVLRQKALQYQLNGRCYHSVKTAYRAAKTNAAKKDIVYVGGSAFTVAEIV